jgi:hypothetical protein
LHQRRGAFIAVRIMVRKLMSKILAMFRRPARKADDDPFAAFSEWSSAADTEAYKNL